MPGGWSAAGGQTQSAYMKDGLKDEDAMYGHSVWTTVIRIPSTLLTWTSAHPALPPGQPLVSVLAMLRFHSVPRHQAHLCRPPIGPHYTPSARLRSLLKMASFQSRLHLTLSVPWQSVHKISSISSTSSSTARPHPSRISKPAWSAHSMILQLQPSIPRNG